MRRILRQAGLVTLCLGALAACGMTPMPLPDPGGLPPGPGLLTGPSGEFTLLSRP